MPSGVTRAPRPRGGGGGGGGGRRAERDRQKEVVAVTPQTICLQGPENRHYATAACIYAYLWPEKISFGHSKK